MADINLEENFEIESTELTEESSVDMTGLEEGTLDTESVTLNESLSLNPIQLDENTSVDSIELGERIAMPNGTVYWNDIEGKPSAFPPSAHTHSEYLTEHQDISGKANIGDSYTKAESDDRYLMEHQNISGKADIDHNHDDSYYTKEFMDEGMNWIVSKIPSVEKNELESHICEVNDLPIWADKSTNDSYGNDIHETYATKDELGEKVSCTDATVGGFGYTKNAGTVTGIKFNGTSRTPENGIVNLGDIVTSLPAIPSVEVGTGYIQIGSLLVCWGTISCSEMTRVGTGTSPYKYQKEITFPKAFSSIPSISLTQRGDYTNWTRTLAYSLTTQKSVIYTHRTQQTTTGSISWIAVGNA